MTIPSIKTAFILLLCFIFSPKLLFSQENIYQPANIDSLYTYLDQITETQIDKLDKKYHSKKEKIYKRRLKAIKNQIEDSTFVFIPELSSQLNRVLNQIYNANPELKQHNFYFLFNKSIIPNAGAYGDGSFVINLGLFDFLESDDELAFVICHEIAHFLSDDFNTQLDNYVTKIYSKETKSKIRQIKRKRYSQTTAGLELIKELSFDMFDYSREKEINADLLGYQLFKKTSYNSNASITALEKLGKLEELVFQDSINLNSFFNFKSYPFKKQWIEKEQSLFDVSDEINDYEFDKDSLRTHPHVKDRIKKLLDENPIDSFNSKRYYDVIHSLNNLAYKTNIQSLRDNNNIDILLYILIRNIQSHKAISTDYDNLAFALKLLHQSKKDHNLGKHVPHTSPFSEEKHLNEVRLFLHNTELRDLKLIGQQFCLEYKDKMSVEIYNKIYKYFKP